jgi:hypothetical protein
MGSTVNREPVAAPGERVSVSTRSPSIAASALELRGGAGPRNIIHDVFILVQIARTDWAKLEGKTFGAGAGGR